MKCATVYRRRNVLFAHASCQTTDGVWILGEPCRRFDTATPAELGMGILEVLKGSLMGVPHPTHWQGVFLPVLDLADVKSWKAFSRGAQCVGVKLEDNLLRLTPTEHKGHRYGFVPLEDATVEVAVDDISAVGLAILKTLELCS